MAEVEEWLFDGDCKDGCLYKKVCENERAHFVENLAHLAHSIED